MHLRTSSRASFALVATALLAACSGADEIISGTALVSTTDEAPGANCELGGTAVAYGVDLNENGTLEATEVASTSYVCATEEGGAPLVSTSPEPAGDNCEFGGFAIASGADTNSNGTLEASEVTATTYACAGEPGPAGAPLGTTTDEAPGDNCEFGGQRVDIGADADGNGTLEASEITSTLFACADATGSLASSANYLGDADAACSGGYVERSFGVDANGNDTLDPSEISATFTSCNLAPSFGAPGAFFVDSCTDGGSFELLPEDIDGSVAGVSVEVLRSVETVAVTVDADGTLTLPGGAYTAGAILLATVTDEFGVETTRHFTLVFNGEGCESLDGFYGVDPESCREVSIGSIAGDDRGTATLSPSYVWYNGDDALIRADLELGNPETVVPGSVDTLFHDTASQNLFSLWSSEFTFTSVLDAEGALEDNAEGPGTFDQIVALDEEDLSVQRSVTLSPPLPRPGYVATTTVDGTELEYSNEYIYVGMHADRFVAASYGWQSAESRYIIVFRIYDAATGGMLHEWYVTDSDEGFYTYDWDTQEVSIQHFPLWVRDGVEYVVFPTNGEGGAWLDLNLRDGSFTTASETFATDCDQQNVAIDASGLRAYSHNEYGCWGTFNDESIAVCDVLLTPNDGSIDDSGEGGD